MTMSAYGREAIATISAHRPDLCSDESLERMVTYAENAKLTLSPGDRARVEDVIRPFRFEVMRRDG